MELWGWLAGWLAGWTPTHTPACNAMHCNHPPTAPTHPRTTTPQDNSTVGIRATLGRLSATLRAHDHELWEHLERHVAINPQFYAFRCVCVQGVGGWMCGCVWVGCVASD